MPDLVVYTELAAGARYLMKTVTKIKPEWLAQMVPALCTLGKPLDQPAPRYDPKTDTILCYMSGMCVCVGVVCVCVPIAAYALYAVVFAL